MNKKSIKKPAEKFIKNISEINDFTTRIVTATSLLSQDESWCFDLAIIRLYREFEDLMLSCLVALINNDSEQFSKLKERKFPKHMSVAVCEYLVYGDGYFDFRGRNGLIKTIKNFVPDGHWFPTVVKNPKYRKDLDRFIALRNFAAHDSAVSKKRALDATGKDRMLSSGDWLKKRSRFDKICKNLEHMAKEIETKAVH